MIKLQKFKKVLHLPVISKSNKYKKLQFEQNTTTKYKLTRIASF